MTKMSDLRDELSDEVGTILAKDFTVTATTTKTVPHSSDGAITFPNLDAKTQACKLIDTCVLYIDIRRSTELSITHKPQTVAKLYSAFVRAMTKCARHYGGHVRGIIGDRVMVIFDCDDCFANAVNCAILMNSAAKYVINKHFTRNEVQCGIGIDTGKMLVTKTGFRRRGVEQHNYKNLVWLGRPANVASKLTDIANKGSEGLSIDTMKVAYGRTIFDEWQWIKEYPANFVKNLEVSGGTITHKNPNYLSHIHTSEYLTTREATKPILMTAPVYNGFKAERPNDNSVKNGWFKKVAVEVPGYTGDVYGGDVHFTAFNE
ncbi:MULTISPECIES: adenylate/guanylate cyclase domain-containing protein [unclassified Novosphingobium]|uniref:adenylate/guanylate cyclase domain-containing protein n=1 Tax=unclassified Novosphingobium TaxID=2644732 RepID=UPI000D30F46C|nr:MULTISPECIES: adenylate/guanylate cyclase domain-containing protein [unclassified Novosphingobium]PTR11063.1 class 3 adenylate cyclase [Novosphingobium sp. GV055]PUB03613.1 class 3 adenylate cyclase [Novosphingobium sp. GV061]PUB20068.1 class 3 adenylate cyclase [Novosphingobium sp. GV079]PUB41829.1 class 3 adenylate cyclase [Novosphingobium sp. GV027]